MNSDTSDTASISNKKGSLKPRFKILLFIAYLVVLVLFIELGLQVVYRIQSGHWLGNETSAQVAYALPVSDRRQYSLRPNYDDGLVTTSAKGFRLPEPNAPTDLIVCAGDSVPFGFLVKNDESYCAALGKAGFNTLNAGIPSYNLRQTFDRLRIDVLPNYPDTRIVTIQTSNDIGLLSKAGPAWNPDLTWADGHLPERQNKIATLYYLKNVLTLVSQGSQVPFDKFFEDERNILREGLQYLRSKGITVILISTNPFSYQKMNNEQNPQLPLWASHYAFSNSMSGLSQLYNAMLRDVAAEFDSVYYLDMADLFDQIDRSDLFVDEIHLSPKGAQIEADYIKALIEKTAAIR